MPVITIDPAQPFEPQVDAAPDGATVVLPPGVAFTTKRVTFEVAPAPPPVALTLKVVVNGVEKASEPITAGDVVEMRVQ